MTEFRERIFEILEEGQKLGVADRLLVNKELTRFEDDYQRAVGHGFRASGTIMSRFAPRLETYGFKMPAIDEFRRFEMDNMKCHLKNTGKPLTSAEKELLSKV